MLDGNRLSDGYGAIGRERVAFPIIGSHDGEPVYGGKMSGIRKIGSPELRDGELAKVKLPLCRRDTDVIPFFNAIVIVWTKAVSQVVNRSPCSAGKRNIGCNPVDSRSRKAA